MRKPFAVLAVVGVLLVAGCTADPGGPDQEAAGDDAAEACDTGAFAAWADAGFSGSIAVSTGGRFDCLVAHGKADDATGAANTVDTVFSIGSVTKAFTAAAVMSLVEDGKLTLDDPAGKLLPELDGPVSRATVRQLMLHTSGLKGTHAADDQPLTFDAAVAAIDRLKLAFRPGSGYLYSNAGYTLLGLIVEKVSGTSYRTYTAAHTLKLPDGRTAGGFWNGQPAAPRPRAIGYGGDGKAGQPGDFAGPHWALDGNGGLAMTARDLAAWTHALFTGRVVSPASAKVLATSGYDHGKGRSEAPGWAAYDASVYGTPFLAAAGGGGEVGHNTMVVWVPEGERVIAITSNRPDAVSAEELLQRVGPALISGDPLPRPATRHDGTGPAIPADVVGTYRLDSGGSFHVTADRNRLAISARGADAVTALFPPGKAISRDDLRRHERAVLDLLAGRTQEGRSERKAFESAFGPITGMTLAGTVVADGEVRTYVTVAAKKKSVLVYYALNREGGVESAEVPTDPPVLRFVPAGDDRYRPDDPAGTGPDVTVAFRDGRLSVQGPAGTTAARLAG